jgi:hypothetical protein
MGANITNKLVHYWQMSFSTLPTKNNHSNNAFCALIQVYLRLQCTVHKSGFFYFIRFMYKLYQHKLYREQIVSAQFVSAQFVSAQFVSDTKCIGHKLYRAQIVSCNKLYRGTNCIGAQILSGPNC